MKYLSIHTQPCSCPFCGSERQFLARRQEYENMKGKSDELLSRIRNYLGNGGLFNPEMMEHNKVRDLLMDLEEYIVWTKDL